MQDQTHVLQGIQAMPHRIHTRTVKGWELCWCCARRLVDHPSLCHCGQPHYCEGRPPNWCQRTGDPGRGYENIRPVTSAV